VSARLPRLHRTAYLMCGDADRADDLVQATLLALYVHWRRARTADNLDGYVHRIMARRFVDEKRRPWSRVFLRGWVPDRPVPADDSLDQRDRVLRALRSVPPGQRAVLVLRYFADLWSQRPTRSQEQQPPPQQPPPAAGPGAGAARPAPPARPATATVESSLTVSS